MRIRSRSLRPVPAFSAALSLVLATILAMGGCAPGTPADSAASAPVDASSEGVSGSNAADPPFWEVAPSPTLPPDRALNAAFLIVDGVYNSELMAPYDILQHTRFHVEPWIEVFTVSPDGEPVLTFEGLTVGAHHSFADAPPIDILLVPSAEHSMDSDLENEAMMTWVRAVGEEAMFVVSLCDGAFVLAAAGLLDGAACTTFPGDQDAFAEKFPDLDLRRGVSFVHDGRAMTSEGGAKSYDVAMYLVDLLYGEEVARRVGRGLIIAWPPEPAVMEALVVP